MGELQVWGDGVTGTAIGADVWNGRTVMVCDWSGGRLLAFTVERGELTPWGDGYAQPESISVGAGDTALVTERTGALLLQNLLDPGRAGATVVAGGLGSPHQVVRAEDGTAALVADHAGGRVLSVDLVSGQVDVVESGLVQPVGLAAGPDGDLYVTEQGTGALTRLAKDGSRSTVLSGLVSPFFLSWADATRTALLVTERSPAHRVGLVDVTSAVPQLVRLLGRGITQPSQAIVCTDRLVVTGADRLLSLDASAGLRPGVTIAPPTGPVWPGAWADLEIDTGVTGYVRGDLAVAVEDADVATLSEHPATDRDPTRPTVRLLAGGQPGQSALVVRDATTSAELGRTEITVGFDETSPVDGPPLWVEAPAGAPPLMTTLSYTKGVDDAGSLRPRATNGTNLPAWRVLAVLVDTGDATWPTTVTATMPAPTVATAQTTWRDALVGTNSVDTFFREMSGGRLGITLVGGSVRGPVSLGGTWTDWFTMSAGQWVAKDDVLTRVVAALQGVGLDWTAIDCVFMVVRSAGANVVWPRARMGKDIPAKVKNPAGKDVDILLSRVAMPHDQTTAAGLGFTNVEVSAHEIGHTVGLDDLYMTSGYTDTMAARDLGTRELMGNESGLPHLSARHKLLLGFLDPANVRTVSYGASEDVTLDLHPLANGLPPAGRFAAVELRVAPKVSWFFEFRQAVGGKLGDGSAFGGGQVMGYDAWRYKEPPLVAEKRRPIILLLDDGDGEGSVLVANQDYEVLDSDLGQLSQFRLDVVSVGAGVARVRVRVRNVQQPDPSIRTNRGRDSDWKSDDIEVRNELSDKDGAWLDKPILGLNRIVAKVKNLGDLPAPGVSVRFKVLPLSTDDPESSRWQELGGPVTRDIPPGAVVEFERQWQPEVDRHHCVQARIDRYTRIPGAAADEPDVDNNLAQSNYFKVYSKPSSPATREVTYVDVHNPFDQPLAASVELRQDTSVYRSYVEHRWIRLGPGETRAVRVEVESKATSIWDAIESRWPDGRTWLRTWFDVPPGHVPRTGSGVSLAVSTAVASDVRVVEHGGRVLFVRVESPAGGPPPSEGSVAMQVEYEDGEREVVVAPVDGSGVAALGHQPRAGVAVLRYSGAPAYAPSDPVEVPIEP